MRTYCHIAALILNRHPVRCAAHGPHSQSGFLIGAAAKAPSW
jgi:hypothetical protein